MRWGFVFSAQKLRGKFVQRVENRKQKFSGVDNKIFYCYTTNGGLSNHYDGGITMKTDFRIAVNKINIPYSEFYPKFV